MILLSSNLQAFLAVVETSTVSAAAVQLGLGQTGITQRLRALERQLGVTLFTRSRKGMLLTHEGRALLKYCHRARELEGETISELSGAGVGVDVDLWIVGPTSCISGRVVEQLKFMYAKWPRVNLQLQVDDRENRLDLLKQGAAHLAVLHPHQVPREMDSKMMKPDEYILLGHPEWHARSLRDILENERLFAFHGEDQTSVRYLETFELLKFLKRPRLFANENRTLARLLIEGAGFGILSREIAAPYVANGQLIKLNQGRAMKDPLALAWFPRSEMPTYFKEIVKAIR